MTAAAESLRLTTAEREGIRDAVIRACAETGALWRSIAVFGSRADPRGRGGDIDLVIMLDPAAPADVYRFQRRLRLALEDLLGEQRIDLVIDDGREGGGFLSLARAKGVELWSNR